LSRPEVRNFVKAYLTKKGTIDSFSESNFVALFKESDDDGNNIITKDELKDLLEKLGL
jgi:EF-hand domain pair